MSMVCGLDLHRQQITFDALETESGEVWRGRVWQPDRERFRRWLSHDVARRANGQPVAMAVEGCTGWRYVVEEITAAGFEAHLAEPADTQAARGRKRHAKTDRSDARMLRELLQSGDLPESWIPPTEVLEWRERVRLYKSLVDQRTCGRSGSTPSCSSTASPFRRRRSARRARGLVDGRRGEPEPGRPATDACRLLDARGHRCRSPIVERRAAALRSSPTGLPGAGRGQLRHRWIDRRGGVVRARRLPSLLPLRTGGPPHRVGRQPSTPPTATAPSGHLTRQGPPTLRWALFEAAMNASRHGSPDHAYYAAVKNRHDGKLAAISVARQFARRCYHILRNLDPDLIYSIPS